MESIKRQLFEARAEISRLQAIADSNAAHGRAAEETCERQGKEILKLMAKLNKANKRIKILEEQIAEARNEIDDRIVEWKTAHRGLKKENDSLKQKLKETFENAGHWMAKKEKLERENKRLREALEAIADDDVEEWEMAGVAMTALEIKDSHS